MIYYEFSQQMLNTRLGSGRLGGGMGTMDFAAQYQQAPVPEEGNLIHWKWFAYYDAPLGRKHTDEIVVSWDTALSSKELSSYSVGIVMQVRGERYIPSGSRLWTI